LQSSASSAATRGSGPAAFPFVEAVEAEIDALGETDAEARAEPEAANGRDLSPEARAELGAILGL